MFWVLWFSLVVIMVSSIAGVFAWNGNLLEVVRIKTAKNLWLLSVVGIAIGLILFLISVFTILNTPSMIIKFSSIPPSPPFWIWIAVILLIAGGLVVGVPTQVYQLKLAKITTKTRTNLFYVGMAILALGVLLLIWLLLPGNQLPS
ncbi:MAG: hypothetical protein QXF56_05900 [Candidatus Micrarchaeia archaeon]